MKNNIIIIDEIGCAHNKYLLNIALKNFMKSIDFTVKISPSMYAIGAKKI